MVGEGVKGVVVPVVEGLAFVVVEVVVAADFAGFAAAVGGVASADGVLRPV